MSDIPADFRDRLDLRVVIAEIDRKRAETEKFVAEQRKLIAEAGKPDHDRMLAPWLAIVGLVGGIITVLGALARWKGWGG
jgi:hypothetical protein